MGGDGRVHARENAEAKALCGRRPDDGKWSRRMSEITCGECQNEIIHRKANLIHFAQPREFTLCGKGGRRVGLWGSVTCPTCKRMKAGAWVPPDRH